MTRIYHQILVKDKKEPDARTNWFYMDTHYTKEEAIADAERRLTDGQTAEFVKSEYV